MQRTKCGNPHHSPKNRKRRQQGPSLLEEQSVPSLARQSSGSITWARLTLHGSDPITGNEENLSSLFYEFYRGYTIYSTPEGRCCIHGKHGCIKLRGQFACFSDIEDAKTLIKWFRVEGYTSSDRIERSLPYGEYACLNGRESHRSSMMSRPVQQVS